MSSRRTLLRAAGLLGTLGLLSAVLVIALKSDTDLDDDILAPESMDAGATAPMDVRAAADAEAGQPVHLATAGVVAGAPFLLPSFGGPPAGAPVASMSDASVPGAVLVADAGTKSVQGLGPLSPAPPPHAAPDGGADAAAPPRGLVVQAPALVVSLEGSQGAGGASARDVVDAGATGAAAPPPRAETRVLRPRRSKTEEGEAIHRVAGFASNGGLSLQGRVVDADTQSPVANAWVEARMGDSFVETRTDPAGAFRLPGLVPGSHIVLWVQGDDTTFVAESVDLVVPETSETADAGTIRVLSVNEFAPNLCGWLGLFVGRRGGHTVVRAVNPWLPADRAGIQVGDRLWSVDGRDVSDLGIRGINVLLRGPVGSKVTLVLQTGAQPSRKVVLSRVQR